MMEKYHVSQEELTQASQMVQQVMDLLAAQASARSQIQDLTQQKKRQMEEMESWMRQFFKIAGVALSDSLQ
jgi:NADH:ubiquinone oxidoreductase subunit D